MSVAPRTMPQNPEAEVAILGGCMLNPDILNEVIPTLSDSHFYQRSHKIIYSTIVGMAKKGLPVDAGTIFNAISTQGKGEEVGGAHYVYKLTNSFPTMGHIRHYSKELTDKLRLRKMLEIASDINSLAWDCVDADECVNRVELAMFNLAEKKNDENLVSASHDRLMEMLSQIQAGEGIGAVKTGLSAVDSVLMGVCPGIMDVYAAEAGCGKSAAAEMMLVSQLLLGYVPGIFQRDMTPTGFYFRLACRMAEVSVSQIRRVGHLVPEKVEKVRQNAEILKKTPLKIYSPDGCTGADVKSIVRREKRKSGLSLVIVDHIRTLSHTKKTPWEGLAENSAYIRQSTNDTEVPHVVLAHINREGAKSDRPTLSDIKGGDQLKDDADNVCVMWAPEGRPDKTERQQWKVNFAFDKTRWDFNCIETMMFDGPTMTFREMVPEPVSTKTK